MESTETIEGGDASEPENTPGRPDTPEIADTPGHTDVSATGNTPERSDISEQTVAPETKDIPGFTDVPEFNNIPERTGTPGITDAPVRADRTEYTNALCSSPFGRFRCLNSFQLKCIAMFVMVLDHAWGTIAIDHTWLTALGRIAFPIFAFQVAEGFSRTHDRKKYLKRMFVFALISEIPFNFMSGGPFYPMHQNVMFTFTLAIIALMIVERSKEKGTAVYAVTFAVTFVVSFIAGYITFVDYWGFGVITVLIFYFFKDYRYGWIGELVCLFLINWDMLGGLVIPFTAGGQEYQFPIQSLALIGLVLTWLYNGKQGPHSKKIQYACYAFYPAHMAVLDILQYVL